MPENVITFFTIIFVSIVIVKNRRIKAVTTSAIVGAITIRLNLCTIPNKRTVSIRGSLGEIIWDVNIGKIIIKKANQEPIIKHFGFDKDEIFSKQLTTFFECDSKHPINLCTIKEGLKTLNLVEQACELSSREIEFKT